MFDVSFRFVPQRLAFLSVSPDGNASRANHPVEPLVDEDGHGPVVHPGIGRPAPAETPSAAVAAVPGAQAEINRNADDPARGSGLRGEVEPGYRAADLFMVVRSAVRTDRDVFAYVQDVLDRLLAGDTDYESLRPRARPGGCGRPAVASCRWSIHSAPAAAEAAWTHGDAWRHKLLELLRYHRDLVQEAVATVPGLSCVPAEATYLAWIDCRGTGLSDPQAACEAAGLGTSDGRDFGTPGFVRINTACPTDRLPEALPSPIFFLRGCRIV